MINTIAYALGYISHYQNKHIIYHLMEDSDYHKTYSMLHNQIIDDIKHNIKIEIGNELNNKNNF